MDEKDEIVIQAGAKKKASTDTKIADSKTDTLPEVVIEEPSREESSDPQLILEETPTEDTVVNDLNDVPSMPTMQIAIIVLAILAIVAFAAYYLLVLR